MFRKNEKTDDIIPGLRGFRLTDDIKDKKTDGKPPEDPSFYKNLIVEKESEYFKSVEKYAQEIEDRLLLLEKLMKEKQIFKDTDVEKSINMSLLKLQKEIIFLKDEFDKFAALEKNTDRILLDPNAKPPEFDYKQ